MKRISGFESRKPTLLTLSGLFLSGLLLRSKSGMGSAMQAG